MDLALNVEETPDFFLRRLNLVSRFTSLFCLFSAGELSSVGFWSQVSFGLVLLLWLFVRVLNRLVEIKIGDFQALFVVFSCLVNVF
jgi:hypothetical protein